MPPMLMTMLFSMLLNLLVPQPAYDLPQLASADRVSVMAAEWRAR